MKKINAKSIAFGAMFTALTYVCTLISVPNGLGGYVNFGDTAVFLAAALMNPFAAAFAGGAGGALADLTLGYTAYAPFTLAVKAAEGLLAGILIRCFATKAIRKGPEIALSALWFVLSGVLMAGGYFGVNVIINDFETAPAAAQLPFDLLQAAIAVTAALLLLYAARLKQAFYKIYRKE